MSKNVHIVSVGTSALANLANDKFTLTNGDALSSIKSVEARGDQLLKDSTAIDQAAQKLASNHGLSAELTALGDYLGRKEVDHVILIATRTQAAKCAATLIERALTILGVKEVQHGLTFEGYVDGHDGEEAETDRLRRFSDDLQVMRAKTLDLVRRQLAQGHTVRIAAQGGYKPEAGVMMLVAAEMGVEAYYSHEEMRRTVVLPTLLYMASLDGVKILAAMPSKRISGQRDCQEFLSKHPELAPGAKGERAHVVYYKRDKHTNEVVSVALTEYGRYLARA